jgi:hypothetical protein
MMAAPISCAAMPALILGPMLRWAGARAATIWVETDGPCTVEVQPEGLPPASGRTFAVAGHHYAIVCVPGLPEDAATPYSVALDGTSVWPEPDSPYPPSTLRTTPGSGTVRVAFGSCRVFADPAETAHGPDALRAFAASGEVEAHHALVLLGDQVYADEVSPETREFIRARRDVSEPPGETIADFEEYTRLYRESWSDPPIRWLLSTISTAMIFDDHDIIDDWNTSLAWIERMRATDWWDRRIVGGLMAYILYQHWGNLHPDDLEEDAVYRDVVASDDGGQILREYAFRCDREIEGTRWSYARDIGRTRLVMIDSRAGRVLTPGARQMVDDDEWRWISEHARGDVDHLLFGTSLPLLMAPSLHHLEAWSEAVANGRWGSRASRMGERVRRAADLEHWPSFQRSFVALCELLREIGAGRHGTAPASIVVLSGDVHHAYLAQMGFPRGSGVTSTVWQATCSPFRNPLAPRERRGVRFAFSRTAMRIGQALSRAAGVAPPPVGWKFEEGDPRFDNQLAMLVMNGRHSRMRLNRAVPGEGNAEPVLEPTAEHELA